MHDTRKTKAQLIHELEHLRERIAALESRGPDEALRESQEWYRLLIQNASDITAMFDADGTILYVSPPVQRILGYEPEELVGKPGTDLIHPEDRGTMLADLAACLKNSGEITTAQYRYCHRDGTWRTLESIANNCLENPAIRAIIVSFRDVTERNRLEEDLHKSQELYRLIAENSPDMITIINPDNSFRYISPAVEQILGYSPEEIYEQMGFDHVHPEDRASIVAAYARLLQNPGELLNTRYRLRHKDGSWRYVEAVGRNVLANPAIRAIFLNVRDITEQKALEDALGTSEERNRLLVQNSSDIIGIMAEDGTPRYVSPSVEKVLGYSAEEAVRRYPLGEVHPEDKEEVTAAFDRCLQNPDELTTVQFRLRHQDGSWRYLESVANSQLANPALRGIVLNSRDITDRKRAEKTLAQSEYKYRFLHENLRDASATVNLKGRIVEFNAAFQDLLGYEPDEIVRLTYRDITPEKWHAMEEKILWEQIMKRGYSEIYEKEYIRKDGTTVPVELRSHIVRDEEGKEVGRWAIIRDISERKRMEEELVKTEKLESLGILCGGIAHDFNNILTAVMTNISMAQMYGDLEEEIEKMLADAEKASLRAKGLTQQLLTFAKGGEPIKKTVAVSKLVRDTVDFALSGSNVKCEHDYAQDLWPIEADEAQIGQVIQNVVLNADQAMPGGGVLRVKAENVTISEEDLLPLTPGPHVRISILDQGLGIPAEHLKKVFDPFFTTKQKGSGLGLSTSFSIVKRHDGSLHVDSRLGGGTEVRVYLPAVADGQPAEGRRKDAFFKGSETVLLVDDDEVLRGSIARALERLGYRVQTAADGGEGVRLYQEARASGRPVDLVVMDLTIPGGMGGLEAAREILAADPGARLIASSGYSTDPVMSGFLDHGFRAVISKPYRMEDLAETLRRVLTEEHT